MRSIHSLFNQLYSLTVSQGSAGVNLQHRKGKRRDTPSQGTHIHIHTHTPSALTVTTRDYLGSPIDLNMHVISMWEKTLTYMHSTHKPTNNCSATNFKKMKIFKKKKMLLLTWCLLNTTMGITGQDPLCINYLSPSLYF